jgi:hypothetical protein
MTSMALISGAVAASNPVFEEVELATPLGDPPAGVVPGIGLLSPLPI